MLNAIWLVTVEQFYLLRRDKFFVPALGVAFLFAVLANMAMDWTVEEFDKILYDIGYFGFQLTGCMAALLWGVKSVNDSRQEGSIEFQLAAPISRVAWLIGKYLGLALSLVLFGVLLIVMWQGVLLFNGFGWVQPAALIVFLFMILGWLVLGAVAVCCSSFMGQAIALFVALALWIAGLATALVAHTLGPNTPRQTVLVVKGITRIWDLQQFNLVDHAIRGSMGDVTELWYRGGYGVLLIMSLMTVACLIFQRRDLIG